MISLKEKEVDMKWRHTYEELPKVIFNNDKKWRDIYEELPTDNAHIIIRYKYCNDDPMFKIVDKGKYLWCYDDEFPLDSKDKDCKKMSNFTKNEMIKFVNEESKILRELSIDLIESLSASSDMLFIKTMEICQYHASKIDITGYIPNEGLNGRSLYKQKLIVKGISEVADQINQAKKVINESMIEVCRVADKFIEENKYYFPDDKDKSD